MRTTRSTCAPERLRAPERKDLSVVTADPQIVGARTAPPSHLAVDQYRPDGVVVAADQAVQPGELGHRRFVDLLDAVVEVLGVDHLRAARPPAALVAFIDEFAEPIPEIAYDLKVD